MIPVTKTFFPELNKYSEYLEKIWRNQWLTNRGELVIKLEQQIEDNLGVEGIILTTNGTLPIQIALKVLGNLGEIITTPFSYVATTSAIVWENCTPVFVDIHPEYLTIDETKIEAAITKTTTAILATHVFGNPCNVKVIEKIAKKYNLLVIYDAAHCYGVKYKGCSLFDYGDVSTCSFHATKLFHTGEGGAMFCKNKDLRKKLFYHHNFGHNGPTAFHGLGVNAKMSELQAAMGLSVLPHIEDILRERKKIVEFYTDNLNWSKVQKLKLRKNTEWNYSYFPIIFKNEAQLEEVQKKLNDNDIYPRRYFYPSLNTLPYVQKKNMPVSESIAARIFCLPLFVGLKESELQQISTIINSNV